LSENAPGQLLGFTIQYPRALCHLLRASPGSTVCVEVYGDVATVSADGSMHAEEDKSSINSNPVTDKSTDLWKTLSNWVNAIKAGELVASNTTFILYRNKSGKIGLADIFDQAKTDEEVDVSIDQASEKMKGLGELHAAWSYYKNTIIDNKKILASIIKNFHLETGHGAGYAEVEQETRNKHVPPSQIKFLVANLNGWLVRHIAEKIAKNLDAKITWEEFDSEFRVLFHRARRLELIDFTLHFPPSNDEVALHLAMRPRYLRQVEIIQCGDDELIEAVTDYLKAKINRDRWIEDDLIDEQLAADFEDKLQRFWKNTQKKIDITNKNLTKEERGKLLMTECMVRSETIRNETPPASTIAGTYHALADKPTLGWHADWEANLKE